MDLAKEIYRGGFYELLRRFETRQRPFVDPLSHLPAPDCDLDVLQGQLVTAPESIQNDFAKGDVRGRVQSYRLEFQGQSQLLYVHAMLIANLRRADPPPEISALFQRLWSEKGVWLGANLSIRWRISAATTFADCGVTPEQRSLGMGLSILFDTLKLYESERRFSGLKPTAPIVKTDDTLDAGIAFDMAPYSMKGGDLDRNMLARLWSLAEQDSTIFPLAKSMLFELMTDDRTAFARIQSYRNGTPS